MHLRTANAALALQAARYCDRMLGPDQPVLYERWDHG
jgi:hypothetical protein